MGRLQLHPDRLFPSEAAVREAASQLFEDVAGLPIVSMHSHIEARTIAENQAFADPSSLLITSDHYVTRLLHAQGLPLEALGVAPRHRGEIGSVADPETVWRAFCSHWPALYGTASHLWLSHVLVDLFGVDEQPSEGNANDLYCHLKERLAKPDLRPQALFSRFGIEVLATTDDPLSDLRWHEELAVDPNFEGLVIPTFRPDRLLDTSRNGWWESVERLGFLTGTSVEALDGLTEAIRRRRRDFLAIGGQATDQALPAERSRLAELSSSGRDRLYAKAQRIKAGSAQLSDTLVDVMASLSCDDGLVMQVHIGVSRDHDPVAARRFGSDVGADFPVPVSLTERLRPLLRHDQHSSFTLVAYTVDEASYGRDLAPMASYYRSLKLGAPWWFLDAPDAMARCLRAATESAGFSNFAGFVDDARAFCSIPARHDMARRVVCGELARLVTNHRLDMDAARQMAVDYCYRAPKRVFRASSQG